MNPSRPRFGQRASGVRGVAFCADRHLAPDAVEPELAEGLKQHRLRLLKDQAPGLAKGLMFPSAVGTYRTPNTLDAAWSKCLDKAKIDKWFTIHGLRYTFTDLVRRANVDAVVRRALTGHVTEEM